jgi:hypothetical protein
VIIASLIGSVDEKVRRAKDVLSILIGIFGTIIGYYFGSDRNNIQQSASESIEISAPRGSTFFVSGQPFNISTMVTGGSPPYNYWIHFESQTITGVTNDFITETLGTSVTGLATPAVLRALVRLAAVLQIETVA